MIFILLSRWQRWRQIWPGFADRRAEHENHARSRTDARVQPDREGHWCVRSRIVDHHRHSHPSFGHQRQRPHIHGVRLRGNHLRRHSDRRKRDRSSSNRQGYRAERRHLVFAGQHHRATLCRGWAHRTNSNCWVSQSITRTNKWQTFEKLDAAFHRINTFFVLMWFISVVLVVGQMFNNQHLQIDISISYQINLMSFIGYWELLFHAKLIGFPFCILW